MKNLPVLLQQFNIACKCIQNLLLKIRPRKESFPALDGPVVIAAR